MRNHILSILLLASACFGLKAQTADSVGIYAGRADACLAEGDALGARDFYRKAYLSASEDMDYERMVLCLNLSSVLIDLAEYSQAYSYISVAEELAKVYPFLLDDVHYQKAGLLAAVGDDGGALDILEPLTRRLTTDSPMYVPAVRSLLELYVHDGRYERAVHKADTLMSFAGTAKDSLYVSRIMVRAFALMRKKEDARHHLEVADALCGTMPEDSFEAARQQRLHGEVAESFGEYETAYQAYGRARSLLVPLFGEGHPESVSLAYGMAKSSLMSGDPARAWKLYSDYLSRKIDYLSGEMFRMNTWEMQSYWNRGNEGLVDAALFCHDVPVADANLSDALNAVMFAKSVSFDTSVGFGNLVDKTSDAELMADYEKLKTLRMRHSQAMRVSRQLSEAIKAEADGLETQIRRRLSSCGLLRDDMSYPDWKHVAKKMDADIVAVEFVDFKVGDSWQYSAFVYGKESKAPVYVPLCTGEDILSHTSTAYLYGDYRVPDSVYDAAFESLYGLLWGPLEQYFDADDRICFSPSGLLHNIPLEYLESEGVMFAERYPQVRRMTVTKDIPYLDRISDVDRLEVFGAVDYYTMSRSRFSSLDFRYLPCTGDEVSNMAEIFAGSGVVMSLREGMDATETDFKQMDIPVSGRSLVHLSTHGFYLSSEDAVFYPYFSRMDKGRLDTYPLLRCGLAMAGANKAWRGLPVEDGADDGILTAQEISEMDLRGVALVVLSACQTGLGDLGRDGVQGFQRAFRLAGAESLMVSLWPVDDMSTMYLMTAFYRGLSEGKDAHKALVDAVREIRNAFPSPYFYAPYVIIS